MNNLNYFYSYFEALEPVLRQKEREEKKFLEVALTGKEELEAMVRYANSLELDEASFLDLGCGVGNVVLRMALEGYKSYGIDYDSNAVELAEKAREDLGISSETAKFAVGNYYPEDILEGQSREEFVERIMKQFRVKRSRKNEQAPGWNSPYEKLGINFSSIDLFYSYPYDDEDRILNSFAVTAREGSILFLQPVFKSNYNLPGGVELIEENIYNSAVDVFIKKN